MSSYPGNIDTFFRPTNGQDYVKAEHIYNLQDAMTAVQTSLVGSGVITGFDAEYISEGSSFKYAVETLDRELFAANASSALHRELTLLEDTAQHHANIISIDTPPSLSGIFPARVQTALEVMRNEINIMLLGDSETSVRGMHLQNTYIRRTEAANIDGSLEVSGKTVLNDSVDLGNSISDQVKIAGDCEVGNRLEVKSSSLFNDSMQLSEGMVFGLAGSLAFAGISFNPGAVTIKSMKDIVLVLDSNGDIDGLNESSNLFIKKHSGDTLFSIDETGAVILASGISSVFGQFSNEVVIGSSNPMVISKDSITLNEASLKFSLDAINSADEESVVFCTNGYTGTDVVSGNVLLKTVQTKEGEGRSVVLYSGTTVLLPGLVEDGHFALRSFSNNAGGEFYGCWVSFRQAKPEGTIPSVSILMDAAAENINNVSVSRANRFGFFIEADSVTVGTIFLFGSYTA